MTDYRDVEHHADYRDPRVTTPPGGAGRWLAIAAGVVVVVLVLLSLMFGGSGTDTAVTQDPAATSQPAALPAADPAGEPVAPAAE
jgi:hypothetical protein